MYDHILVPSDGSELAWAGVNHALAMAKLHGSRITAITVTEPFGGEFAYAADLWTPAPEELASYNETQEQIAQRILAPIKAKAEEMGLTADTMHMCRRPISNALVAAAEQLGCSAIVMSSHGRTGVMRAMLGSQASAVSAAAKVPVIIVK